MLEVLQRQVCIPVVATLDEPLLVQTLEQAKRTSKCSC